jgi:uncharacterized protein YegJ (DUF2314 family)
MTDDLDMQLPLDGFGDDRPWALPEQEPSTFIALWPDDQPPMVTEITSAIAGVLEEEMNVLGEIDPEECDGELQWVVVVELPGLPFPVMLWAEQAKPIDPSELDPESVQHCRWAIGAETVLGTDDPLSAHTFVMKVLAAAFFESPAILDVNCAMWHTREELDSMYLSDEVEPPFDGLFIIHSIGRDRGEKPRDEAVWLHTHGLWRCGLPELEMLEVPREHVDVAATLLNEIASLLFEYPPPAAGEPFEVGAGVAVTFQPWQVVIETMAPEVPGGRNHRNEKLADSHTGVRAVVCDPEPRGKFRPAWTWPQAAIHAIQNEDVSLYRTRRATERQAMIARSRWDQFATAYSSVHRQLIDSQPKPGAMFLVKAGYQRDGADHEHEREHLWFDVRGFHGEQAEGVLLNQPQNITGMTRGTSYRIDRDTVSDWRVQTALGVFGPDTIEPMWRALDSMKAKQQEQQL